MSHDDRNPDPPPEQSALASGNARIYQARRNIIIRATPKDRPAVVTRRKMIAAIAFVAVAVLGVAAGFLVWRTAGGTPTDMPPVVSSVNPRPLAASSASPPVAIENVSPMTSNIDGYPSFVLPAKLVMSDAQVKNFDTQIYPQSSRYLSWYAEHDGAALDFGLLTVTLGGNSREKVRVTDLEVDKKCRQPLDGAYFEGYSQGESNNIAMAFDLDSPDPTAQEMAYPESGPVGTGDSYFRLHTLDLAPGEKVTVTVGAMTSKYSCSFTMRLIVATSTGSYWEKIDNNGKAFQVTARAPATKTNAPLSGYQAAYVLATPPNGWQQVDPSTYTGNN